MIRFIISASFILFGISIFVISALGNYRYAYILNRMQVSANADTLATSSIVFGLIVCCGFTLTSLKLIIMLLFLWIANPVASHFLAKTNVLLNKNIKEECEVVLYANEDR